MINRLYYAAKIYFSSYGIAWFDLDLFIKLLNYILRSYKTGNMLSVKDLNELIRHSGIKFVSTGKEGYYYAKLLRYLDLIAILKTNKGFIIKPTSYGVEFLLKLNGSTSISSKKELLRELFLKWDPLLMFLKYLDTKKSATINDVVRDLGGSMKKWNEDLYEIGVTRKIMKRSGVAKPYDSFVVRNLFVKLAKQLDLIEFDGNNIKLLKDRSLSSKIQSYPREHDIIKTMPGEYTIYSAVADTIYDSEESIIVSPWIDDILIQLISKILKINNNLGKIVIVTRPLDKNKKNKKYIKKLATTINKRINLKVYGYKHLHAKISLNPKGSAVISSANLIKTSLLRNYKIGVYYRKTPSQVQAITYELIEILKPIVI